MKLLLHICAYIICLSTLAQTKIRPKLYSKEIKLATIYFVNEDYLNALNEYRKVLAINPEHENAQLNSLICRINLNQLKDSLNINASNLLKSEIPESKFYLGRYNHLLSNFEEATKYYNEYKAIPIKLRSVTDEEVSYYIDCTNNAIEYLKKPHRSVIKNVGNYINTIYPEYVPLITPDEKIMYFTSRREGSTGDLKDAYGNFYEDVYLSVRPIDGNWGKPRNIGPPINTNTHDACVALSFDGNQMIIFRTSPEDNSTGDLYISKNGFDGWSIPEKLGPEINTPYIETSACFSTDTSVIYFSSNKPGGFGGKDIYRVKKLPNGKWSQPMNLGSKINTSRDEDSPFLHPDGTTLYFSSKGHSSMGDYDVYKTTVEIETNIFSSPENLGYPINSVNNDIFFVLNANGTHGYYSSIKEDSYGSSDIYVIDTRYGDNDLKVKQGIVLYNNEINKAKITLIDIESKQVAGIYNANVKTGKFIIVMNPLKSYKAIIEEEGFQTLILDIPPMVEDISEKELIINLIKK